MGRFQSTAADAESLRLLSQLDADTGAVTAGAVEIIERGKVDERDAEELAYIAERGRHARACLARLLEREQGAGRPR